MFDYRDFLLNVRISFSYWRLHALLSTPSLKLSLPAVLCHVILTVCIGVCSLAFPLCPLFTVELLLHQNKVFFFCLFTSFDKSAFGFRNKPTAPLDKNHRKWTLHSKKIKYEALFVELTWIACNLFFILHLTH